MKQVIVIGGGPSGMMAAIAAARSGARTTLLEAGPKPGRKLLLTGNGRCNMTNLEDDILSAYRSSDMENARIMLRSVFGQFSVEDTLRFFHEEGLLTSVEHGSYVYPVTGQSSSVLDVLLRAMGSLKIKMKFNEEAIAVEKAEDSSSAAGEGAWCVRTKTWAYSADSVIISCGSRAVPSTGANGAGYELSRMLGLDVTDILPALTAVSCSLPEPDAKAYVRVPGSRQPGKDSKRSLEDPLYAASGTRTGAVVTVFADGEMIARERGQIQFTQQDLSGVVVFNLSRYVMRALHSGCEVELGLDLLPDAPLENVEKMISDLSSRYIGMSIEKLLAGLVPSRMIPVVLAECELTGESIASVLKNFRLKALRLRGFDSAQVCVGGVRVTELDARTLECRSDDLKGIYLTGELIDIDGPCGGYNLQWAWSSGYTAGTHAAASAT